MKRLMMLIAVLAAVLAPTVVLAQPAPLPGSAEEAYAPFLPLVGKTWRGRGTGTEGVEDVQRWDWAIGGHAVRVTHAVNGGVYGGETLIFKDKDSGDYVFHYFTSGGFHTTGVITPSAPGVFQIEEAVHGVEDLEALRSTGTLGPDGIYRVRAMVERDGRWVESGGFDYREDASAAVAMPVRPGQTLEASAGPPD